MAGTDFSHLTDDELINGIKALNIPDYIRSKAYGIDVRETIAQMTEMLMQLALNQGMNPQEAQDFMARFNNKINKGEVTMSDLTQEVKTAMTGGSVAVVGVDAVGTENIKDGAVTIGKLAETTFEILSKPRNYSVSAKKTIFAKSKNLFDGNYIRNMVLTGDTDSFRLGARYGGIVVIQEVDRFNTYTIHKSKDTDRFRIGISEVYPEVDVPIQHISAWDNNQTQTVSMENNRFIVVFLSSTSENKVPSQFQIEEGEEFTGYVSPSKVKIDFEKKSIEAESIKTEDIIISPNQTTFAEAGKNKFDGVFRDNMVLSGEASRGFILAQREGGKVVIQRIEPYKTYTVYKSADTDRFSVGLSVDYPKVEGEITYVSDSHNSQTSTFSTNEENYVVIYVSSVSENKEPSELQIEEGNKFTEYVKPGTVKIELDPSSYGNNSGESKQLDTGYFVVNRPKGNYTNTSDYEPFNRTSGINVLNELYAEWDNLSQDNGILGYEPTGLPINYYHIKPHDPQGNLRNKSYPKIIYVGGIHGHERFCNYEDLRFFKDLVNNWKTNENLQLLRNNVHFIVIPVLNPWGFANLSRINSNGVDLNRNFEHGWVQTKPGQTYSGANPLSEIESQLIDQLLEEHNDAIFALDHHNYETLTKSGHVSWMGTRSDVLDDLLYSVAAFMDGDIKKKIPSLLVENPENDTKNLFKTQSSIGGGLATNFAMKHGINGMILETIGGWGNDYTASYEELQSILADLIGNLLDAVVSNNQWLNNGKK